MINLEDGLIAIDRGGIQVSQRKLVEVRNVGESFSTLKVDYSNKDREK
jgi:hypothetical protein